MFGLGTICGDSGADTEEGEACEKKMFLLMVITVMDVFLACFCLSAVRNTARRPEHGYRLAVSAEPDEPDSAGQGESARKRSERRI